MITNNRQEKMQTNKKTNPAGDAFDMANSINQVSRTGMLYGKLFAIKDMQIHLLEQEKLLKEEIERCEGLEKLKERKNKWVKYEWIPNLETRF